jgi:hypothetical protein
MISIKQTMDMPNWSANAGRPSCAYESVFRRRHLSRGRHRETTVVSAMVMSGVPVPTNCASLMMQPVVGVDTIASFKPIVVNDHQNGGHLSKRPAAWDDPQD